MKTILCLLILTAASVRAANIEEWLKNGLLRPDVLTTLRDELALTDAQQTKLNTQLSEARLQAEPLEQKVKEEQKALGRLLQDTTTTPDAAAAQLTRLIEAETAVKQLQLRVLIGVRDVLTPEQLEKAKKLSPPKMAALGDLETQVNEKIGKLRTALDSLGIPPTEAMKARGSEIEELIKSGQWAEANAKVDQLVEDAHLKEMEVAPESVDFTKVDPGNTELTTLRERYDALKGAGQEIVSLPLMRDLLQAKAAFEEAKEAQDADKAGRILTYVEGKLSK